jgi:hypothetical protein
MSQKRKNETGKEQQDWSLNLDGVHANAAGIDIGNESHYVAVPPDREPGPVAAAEDRGHVRFEPSIPMCDGIISVAGIVHVVSEIRSNEVIAGNGVIGQVGG